MKVCVNVATDGELPESRSTSNTKVSKKYLGLCVTKNFGTESRHGTVVSADLHYLVAYDDNEMEHLELNELQDAIRLNMLRTIDKGSRVLIQCKSAIRKATVLKGGSSKSDGSEQLLVHYDGNKKTTKNWVSVSHVQDVIPSEDDMKQASANVVRQENSADVIDVTGEDEIETPPNNVEVEVDLTTANVNHPIREGQHVWVRIGKAQHEAVVESINRSKAKVKWLLSGSVEEVDVGSIEPMSWTNVNDEMTNTARKSKRQRRKTNKFSPS